MRWRIRALRTDRTDNNMQSRQNGLPAVGYGPWSPVYSSTNPPYVGGPITLGHTISDIVSTGDASPAHRLMPAFTFSGDQASDGTSAELFRVYVFTDRQCLNRVFASAVFGGPAYAPRPFGPLALPASPASLPTARATYLNDGSEPDSFTFDGLKVQSTELTSPATPTTAVPADSDSTSTASPAAGPQQIQIGSGVLGAPVDLWDTDWPGSGYYWTVIPVEAVSPGALKTSTAGVAAIGGTSVTVTSAVGFSSGDTVSLGNALNQETVTVVAVNGNTLTLAATLKSAHGAGEPITRTGGNLRYQDLELAQDVCAARPRKAIRQEQRAGPHGCRRALRLGPVPEGTPHVGDEQPVLLRLPARCLDTGPRRHRVRSPVEQEGLSVQAPAEPAEPERARHARARDVNGPPAQAGHVVLPRAWVQLRIADRCAADVLVGPRQDRRRETEVPRRRPGK